MSMPNLIPLPRVFTAKSGTLGLAQFRSKPIYIIGNTAILPLVEVFRRDFEHLTGYPSQLINSSDPSNISDDSLQIRFILESSLGNIQYRVQIADEITLTGGSAQALHWAAITILQLLPNRSESGDHMYLPCCEIADESGFPYIGLMIDLARKWHPVPVLRQLILLCRWYKIPFLHLHFTDNQSYTLPSQIFPKLPTHKRSYTKEELRALDQFARDRGVTIIPEIDLPGHAKAMVNAYPKLFGIKPLQFGKFGKPKANIINIGKDSVYEAVAQIIKEVIDLFPHAPYFHLGADEVNYKLLENDPDIQDYCIQHNYPNVQELYRSFIGRMNEVVKGCGKQMCVWEGFRPEGIVPIPKDIPVFVFESLYNTADRLVADGYTVVNTSWMPIYVTTRKNWTPEEIYGWNPYRWQNWVEKSLAYAKPIEIPKGNHLMGAQMCSWEQSAAAEIPSLRHRVATFIDRVWGNSDDIPFADFETRLVQQDAKLELLLSKA
jgi:hexosaminidase